MRCAVHEQHATAHLPRVALQGDHALDEVVVLRSRDADPLPQPVDEAADDPAVFVRRRSRIGEHDHVAVRHVVRRPCRSDRRGSDRPGASVGSIEPDGMKKAWIRKLLMRIASRSAESTSGTSSRRFSPRVCGSRRCRPGLPGRALRARRYPACPTASSSAEVTSSSEGICGSERRRAGRLGRIPPIGHSGLGPLLRLVGGCVGLRDRRDLGPILCFSGLLVRGVALVGRTRARRASPPPRGSPSSLPRLRRRPSLPPRPASPPSPRASPRRSGAP